MSTYPPKSATNGHGRARNVLGGPLGGCCTSPMTGFFRNGRCDTNEDDAGMHVVCAVLTEEFLDYTKSRGNDLSTPRPEWGFPGLQPGQKWCLCAARWLEAYQDGVAPPVVLEATHEAALRVCPLDALKQFAVLSDEPGAPSA
jgi:uncharacterized protein (DUF2237 family)